ncbi:hypothetical protein CsatA_016878 [Cannabis sativa]
MFPPPACSAALSSFDPPKSRTPPFFFKKKKVFIYLWNLVMKNKNCLKIKSSSSIWILVLCVNLATERSLRTNISSFVG